MERSLILLILVGLLNSCSSFEETKDGLKYKFHVQNKENRQVKEGELALCYYTIKYEDTVLYNTYEKPDPARIAIQSSGYKGDLFDALQMMHEGDSATFIFNADSFYTITNAMDRPDVVQENGELEVTMKIMQVVDEDEYKLYLKKEEKRHVEIEKKNIQEYIHENYLTLEYDSFTEVWYRVQRKDSLVIMPEDVVTFHCLGRTLDGKTIINTYTNNKPMTIQIGHENFRLPVLDELLQFMGEKDNGKFIVPYLKCFGPEGDGYGIPQYSTFVFDIFVEKVVR